MPGVRGKRDEYTQHEGFLGQWKYSAWYNNDGYMSLYICQNPEDAQHQEWTLM